MSDLRKANLRPTVKALDGGLFEFVASTPTEDRVGDMIEQGGWDLRGYTRNPVVLYAHDYAALPVGRAESVALKGGNLVIVVRFASHARAQEVEAMYREGFLSAVSVGFRAKRVEMRKDAAGYVIKEAELLEVSCVPVPCNAEALIAGKAAGKRMLAVGEKPPVADEALMPVVEAWVKSVAPTEVKVDPVAAQGGAATTSTAAHGSTWIVTGTRSVAVEAEPPAWAKALMAEVAALRAEIAKKNTGPTVAASADDEADPDEVDDSPAMTEALLALEVAGLEAMR